MMGGRAELIVEPSYSPLINNDHMVDLVRNVACAQFGSDKVILRDVPSLGVEDFAYFAADRPSCFFHLGCAHPEEKRRIGHSCFFDIDERCIPIRDRVVYCQRLALFTTRQQRRSRYRVVN